MNQQESGSLVILSDHVHLYEVAADQFKVNGLNFHFKRPLTEREATLATVMSNLMTKCNGRYKQLPEYGLALDALYGSAIYNDVEKYGEMLAVQIKAVFPKDHHLPEPILGQVIDFIQESLFNPAFLAEDFDMDLLEMERQSLLDEYQSRKNDKITYSYDRLIEEMCNNEAYRTYAYGNAETLTSLTIEDLRAYYHEWITSSAVDIIALGSFDSEALKNQLSGFPFHIKSTIETTFDGGAVMRSDVKSVQESDEVSQAKLNIGYRLPVGINDSDYYAAVVMSFLFGNGVNSYLFRILREKENLCYYAFSRLEGYKGLMVVGSGIDANNALKAQEIIEDAVTWLKEAAFTDQELALAKIAVLKGLESTPDSIFSLAAFTYGQLLRGNLGGMKAYKASIEAVDREAIQHVAQRLKRDTVYLLCAEEDHNEGI